MSGIPAPPIARPQSNTRGPAAAYGMAMAFLVGAIGLRALLDPWMGDTMPLVTLFGAVAAAVWIGGSGAAIAVVVLGFAACDYLFIQPRGHFVSFGLPGLIGLLAYLCTCALIVFFGDVARRAQRQANDQRELLRRAEQ